MLAFQARVAKRNRYSINLPVSLNRNATESKFLEQRFSYRFFKGRDGYFVGCSHSSKPVSPSTRTLDPGFVIRS
jgi:hypothetical protein